MQGSTTKSCMLYSLVILWLPTKTMAMFTQAKFLCHRNFSKGSLPQSKLFVTENCTKNLLKINFGNDTFPAEITRTKISYHLTLPMWMTNHATFSLSLLTIL